MLTLLDLGERQILREIIPRYAVGTGDDCAVVKLPLGTLVVTTDPVPPPAAASIGQDSDAYWMGWLLVTINASDLAAAGATPLAFLAAIECESNTEVSLFERLLEGIKAGCEECRLPYVGGNIREAPRISAVGIALGLCHPHRPLQRIGAQDGDIVLSVGQGGVFWRDAIRMLDGQGGVIKEQSPLYKPRSQIGFMHQLASRGLVKAAMDNSDGLLPSLMELAGKNGLGLELDTSRLRVPELVESERADEARMWLGWGDWNVIICVAEEHEQEVLKTGRELGATIVSIGRVTETCSGVILRNGERAISAPRLESERFAKDSWMSKGIGEYVRMLRAVPLP